MKLIRIAIKAVLVAAWCHVALADTPNILVVIADDLGWADVGFNGSREIPTPHLDSLAANGVRCTAGYVTAPQCSPTRAGMLTGRYQQRFGHESNNYLLACIDTCQRLFPEHFKAAGYATGMVGKWHLGDSPAHHPQRHGFDDFFGFQGGGHAYLGKRPQDDDNPVQRGTMTVRLDGKEFLTTTFGREAAAFIRGHAQTPWCLYAPFNAPHMPMTMPPGYEAKVAHIPDKTRRLCVAMIMNLDDAIGDMLAALRDTGQEDRTLVVFLSDNGGTGTPDALVKNASLNVPFRGVKGDVYEGGIRVPFVVQWKGRLPAGRTFEAPVCALDILPTALAAAGVNPLPGTPLEGVNLLPHLRGEAQAPPHDMLFWRWQNSKAVRQGDWKWVVASGRREEELFDLATDPSEQHDLAADKPERVKAMAAAFAAWDEKNPPLDPKHFIREGGPKAGRARAALPQLRSPASGAVLTHPVPAFQWQHRPPATIESLSEYAIRISTDAAGKDVVDEDRLPAVLGWYVPDKALAPGEYWWRVGEATADGGVEWSAARKFSVRVPEHVVAVPKSADFQEIQAAIAAAAAQTPAVVRFEEGEYRLDPGDRRVFIDLEGVDDLIVDGRGAKFVFTRPVALAHLTACRRVLIEDFTFDLDPPASSAGRVVAVNKAEGSIEAEILPGHPLPDAWPAFASDRRGLIVVPDEHFAIKRGVPLVIPHGGFERLEGRRFRFRFENQRLVRAFAPGDVYVLDPRWNAEGGDGAVIVAGGEDVVLHRLTIHSTANECFTSRHATRLAILGVRLERLPGRALTANNGGNNHHNDRIGPWIEGCLFENCGDDVCHVNGLAMSIAEQPAPDRLVFKRRQLYDRYGDAVALDLRVGDRLVAFHRDTGRSSTEATILDTTVHDAAVEVTLDKPWTDLRVGDLRSIVGVLKPSSRKTGAARTAPAGPATMPVEVYNLDRMCNQFVFRHNVARYSRRIGVLAKGDGGLVEHNLFENLGGGGVEMMNTPFEGLAAANYVIRDNVIRDCGRVSRDDAGIQAMLFKSGGDRVHRDLLITGNEIINFSGPAIWLKDARDALVSGNRLEWRGGDTAPAAPDEPIVLENTEGVRLENNSIE